MEGVLADPPLRTPSILRRRPSRDDLLEDVRLEEAEGAGPCVGGPRRGPWPSPRERPNPPLPLDEEDESEERAP